MGQRHQIYVVKKNGGFFLEDKKSNNYKNHVSKYGSKPTIIFPYHHQWLYGQTALMNCLNLFRMGQKINYPRFDENGFKFEELTDIYKNIQSLTLREGKINFETLLFEGDDNPQSRFHFDLGDNNDGITIVFPEEKKYCFMFINTPIDGQLDRVPYVPMNAEQYLKCYYPEEYNTDPTLIRTVKSFNKYSVMTAKEIKSYFPRMTRKPVTV